MLIADYWIVRQTQLRLEDLYLPDGAYRYTAAGTGRRDRARSPAARLAWGGLVVPALRPLYDYAWFVGFGVRAVVYLALAPRPRGGWHLRCQPPLGGAKAGMAELRYDTPMVRVADLTLGAAAILCAVGLQGPPAAQQIAPFDAEYARLKQGRPYRRDVQTGALKRTHGAFDYWLVVPATYDPAKRYQVRFQLHGGVMRADPSLRGDGTIGALAGAEQIYIMPAAWHEAPWWSDEQIANLRAILDNVKRDYNVDENRVVVAGVSDGGTGAYYVAMRDTTPYASFLPLNGFIMVLRNPDLDIRRRSVPEQSAQQAVLRRQRRPGSAVSDALVEPSIAHMHEGAACDRLSARSRRPGTTRAGGRSEGRLRDVRARRIRAIRCRTS